MDSCLWHQAEGGGGGGKLVCFWFLLLFFIFLKNQTLKYIHRKDCFTKHVLLVIALKKKRVSRNYKIKNICVIISRGERRKRKMDGRDANALGKWHCIQEQSGHAAERGSEGCDLGELDPGNTHSLTAARKVAASHSTVLWTHPGAHPSKCFYLL